MFSPLRQSDPDWFEFDWLEHLTDNWGPPGRRFSQGDVIAPSVPMGYYAECTSVIGMCGRKEPGWPEEDAATVVDGSITWTMRAPGTVTLPVVASCTYTITPSGISQDDTAVDVEEGVSKVRLDASAADLGTYKIVANMTDSQGEEHTQVQYVTVVE